MGDETSGSGDAHRSYATSVTALGFVASILGGAILAISYIGPIPDSVFWAGVGLFVLGVISIFAAAVIDARHCKLGIFRALWLGVRTALRWLVAVFP